MKSMRAVAIGIITIGALACATLIVAQQQTAPPRNPLMRVQDVETSRDSRTIGIEVVRNIETAEVEHRAWHGAFADWTELYRSPDEEKRWQRLHVSAGPEVVPGWTLSLVAAADGKSFELSLRNLTDPCAFSFFSDQRGIIYQGGVIDCSVDLRPRS